MIEMLFRCNILAIVGGGRIPRFPNHKVMIWDDHQNRCIGELSFRAEVKAVRLRRDRVVVALERRIYIYNFADLTLVDHLETVDNPRGLCCLSASSSNNVLACPGIIKGHVRVELYDTRKTTLIAAHEANLACMTLNLTGTRLATASEKGTLIRIYDTSTGDLLQELRRGADKADIHCLAFNQTTSMLACTSDKGTCHIFKLKENVWDTTSSSSSASVSSVGNTSNSTSSASASSNNTINNSTGTSSSGTSNGTTTNLGTNNNPSGNSSGIMPSSTPSSSSNNAARSSSSLPPSSSSASSSSSSSSTLSNNNNNNNIGSTLSPSSPLASNPTGEEALSTAGGNSGFSLIKNILPKYFSSEWSFAQFRVPDNNSICAFGNEPNTLIVVGSDGSFFKANFEKGGEAVRVAYGQFVKTNNGTINLTTTNNNLTNGGNGNLANGTNGE